MSKRQERLAIQEAFVPQERFTSLFPETSGNEVNGLGEKEIRPPSPMFWHPSDQHPYGELQQEVVGPLRGCPETAAAFAGEGHDLVEQTSERVEKSAKEWTSIVKEFVLAKEGDLVGITDVKPIYVFDGYEIKERMVIMIGVAMDYDRLNVLPPAYENPDSAVEVGHQYSRAARVCHRLTNFIREQGHAASACPGPRAGTLNMLAAAIDAGLGELGKHGSLINREFGASFRLSGVTTDLPLISDTPDNLGVDDFCMNCQICSEVCPPAAIFDPKQVVRGAEKWYVNFDKCIPYFGETLGCGMCIATCPWSKPGASEKLAQKMLKRREKANVPAE